MVAQIEHAVPYVTNRFDGLRARRNSYFKGRHHFLSLCPYNAVRPSTRDGAATSLSSTSPAVEHKTKSGQHSTERIVTRSLHLNDAHVAEASAASGHRRQLAWPSCPRRPRHCVPAATRQHQQQQLPYKSREQQQQQQHST